MINAIGIQGEARRIVREHARSSQAQTEEPSSPQVPTAKASSELLKNYFVSFKGKKAQSGETIIMPNKFDLEEALTPMSRKILDETIQIAHEHNHKKIDRPHLFLAIFKSIDKYIEDTDSGKINPDENNTYTLPIFFQQIISKNLLNNAKTRNKFKPLIKEKIVELQEEVENLPKEAKKVPINKIGISTELWEDMGFTLKLNTEPNEAPLFTDDLFGLTLLNSQDEKTAQSIQSFITKAQKAIMEDTTPLEKQIHIPFYNNHAKRILTNLDMGTNMIVVFDKDNEDVTKHLNTSLQKIFSEETSHLKNINPDKTELVIFNDNITSDYLKSIVDKAKKTPEKQFILVVNASLLVINSNSQRGAELSLINLSDLAALTASEEEDGPKNIKVVMAVDKTTYFNTYSTSPILKKLFASFGVDHLPIMNAAEARKLLISSPSVIEQITKKEFSKGAINLIIEISNTLEGNFPEKAFKLMKNIASYHAEKKEVTANDVNSYFTKMKENMQTTTTSSEFKLELDVKKHLKDIVGSGMTKAEAQNIVKQIKHKQIGTKGYLIYSTDGGSGGGRKNTAEAIAGEAGIPMITINARDFAVKDIDALSQNGNLPELKMKKLMNMAKTQAEANKNKTAMVYIENFDNFGSDPLYGISSIYEQKAFSKMLEEMESLKGKEVNIIVMGSTTYPESIDTGILRPNKFLDSIIVYPPQSTQDRTDVINYYLKKRNLNLQGDSPEQRNKIIKEIAETTKYFSVVDLMYLIDKTKNILKEKNKKVADKAVFVEAYLQTTSGRPSTLEMTEHSKGLMVAHECGHAICTQLMYEIATKENIEHRLPDELDFLTLDPRGWYLGAMYSKDSINKTEVSFEKMFSNLVTDYGGNAAETYLYDMNGSWGITQDMEMATHQARTAVCVMGLGHNTGKRNIPIDKNGKLQASSEIEKRVDKDIDILLKNSSYVADLIIKTYKPFIKEFSDKYKAKVGTGECIVHADEFISELNKWRNKQSPAKKAELKRLESRILEVIKMSKNGKTIKQGKASS